MLGYRVSSRAGRLPAKQLHTRYQMLHAVTSLLSIVIYIGKHGFDSLIHDLIKSTPTFIKSAPTFIKSAPVQILNKMNFIKSAPPQSPIKPSKINA